MAKWLLIGILALAAAGIAVLAPVAAVMGLTPASALLLPTALTGLIVLQRPGRVRLERLRSAVTRAGIVGLEVGGDAFLTVSAGFLLVLPGVITDVARILLLLPPVRRRISARFQRFARTR